MLMVGLAGLELAAQERSWLAAPCVAGVLLFSRNFQSRAQLLALCDAIRAAERPLAEEAEPERVPEREEELARAG